VTNSSVSCLDWALDGDQMAGAGKAAAAATAVVDLRKLRREVVRVMEGPGGLDWPYGQLAAPAADSGREIHCARASVLVFC
jgi:hypothetical protein